MRTEIMNQQIELLAAFLLAVYPDEIDGSAVEVAIKLLDDPRVVGVLHGTLRTVEYDDACAGD